MIVAVELVCRGNKRHSDGCTCLCHRGRTVLSCSEEHQCGFKMRTKEHIEIVYIVVRATTTDGESVTGTP